MDDQHQRRALAAIAAGLVLLPAGCTSGTAAAAPPTVVSPAASTAAVASNSTTTAAADYAGSAPRSAAQAKGTGLTQASPKPGDGRPGCAARAMARGTFNPACREYQGYLDPGTAGGRAPTSGEIQRQNLCRSGQIPKAEC